LSVLRTKNITMEMKHRPNNAIPVDCLI
jgi:hypothetical protein